MHDNLLDEPTLARQRLMSQETQYQRACAALSGVSMVMAGLGAGLIVFPLIFPAVSLPLTAAGAALFILAVSALVTSKICKRQLKKLQLQTMPLLVRSPLNDKRIVFAMNAGKRFEIQAVKNAVREFDPERAKIPTDIEVHYQHHVSILKSEDRL